MAVRVIGYGYGRNNPRELERNKSSVTIQAAPLDYWGAMPHSIGSDGESAARVKGERTMASVSGWYDTMSTQDLRDEADRAEREAENAERERVRRNAENAERDSLIARIENAKRRLIDPAL